eukprot:5080904-Prorocentrum_lima.AAC.1
MVKTQHTTCKHLTVGVRHYKHAARSLMKGVLEFHESGKRLKRNASLALKLMRLVSVVEFDVDS